MEEKLIFVPSGVVVAEIQKGIDPKKTIELHGHDAGEFVPASQLQEPEKQLAKIVNTKGGI